MVAARDVLAVAVGGAVGSALRYIVGEWTPRSPHGFPWATFTVNVTGAFLLGLLLGLGDRGGAISPTTRLLLGTGLLGGYTTFSTMSLDTLNLIRTDDAGLAAAYALGSLALGLGAAAGGVWCGRSL